jgi:hypothetical protein
MTEQTSAPKIAAKEMGPQFARKFIRATSTSQGMYLLFGRPVSSMCCPNSTFAERAVDAEIHSVSHRLKSETWEKLDSSGIGDENSANQMPDSRVRWREESRAARSEQKVEKDETLVRLKHARPKFR